MLRLSLTLLLFGFLCATTHGEGRQNPVVGGSARLPTFTPEREAAAIAFVTKNHPELAALLNQLRESNPGEYQSAVRQLFHASEKLAESRSRDAELAALELEHWKVRSRIQLLAARARMNPDSTELQEELRMALEAQQDLQIQRLKLQQKRYQARLEKLAKSIASLTKQADQQIEREIQRLLGPAAKAKGARAAKNQ